MKFTEYYINDVLSRRPYLKAEWLEKIINNPVRAEVQSGGTIRWKSTLLGIRRRHGEIPESHH
jgi:hypothetical protein